MAARAAEAPAPDPGWRRNLTVLWWTQLAAVAGMALILPFLPLLVRQLAPGLDLAQVQRWSGAIFAAPFLFAALMTPVWGWVGDHSGRKLMVVRALVGLSAAIFLMAFARSPGQLLLLRILQGMVSGFIPAAIALVSASAPREKLGYALAYMGSSQAGGVVVGPLLGGVLADLLGYRALFLLTAGIELAAATAAALLVIERPRPAGRERPPSLLENARHAAHAPIPVAIAGLFLTQLSILVVQPFLALYVESLGVSVRHLSTTTGIVFGVTGLATLLSAPRWGRLGDRIGRRRVLTLASVGAAGVFLLQGAVHRVVWLFCLRLLQGILAGGMLPALYAIIATHTPERQRGGVMGFGSSATLFGGLAGPILGGYLAARIGMRLVFVVSTGLLALNAANALRLPPDREPRLPAPRRSWELPSQ